MRVVFKGEQSMKATFKKEKAFKPVFTPRIVSHDIPSNYGLITWNGVYLTVS